MTDRGKQPLDKQRLVSQKQQISDTERISLYNNEIHNLHEINNKLQETISHLKIVNNDEHKNLEQARQMILDTIIALGFETIDIKNFKKSMRTPDNSDSD